MSINNVSMMPNISTFSLKFCSWNIEGLHGKIDDIDFISTINQFDFVSLVETWLPSNTNDLSIDGFYSFSKCRKQPKNTVRNSGGISVLVKSSIRTGVKFFADDSSENFVWWKLDKKFFRLSSDIYVCSVYIPPQNSSRERRINRDHFGDLQEKIYKFSKLGKIVLCGDFNARMGNLDDTVEDPDSQFTLINRSNSLNFPRRFSRDLINNSYGILLSELCCGNDLIALNGRSKGDFAGQFTCQTYNGASIVDYVIVSQSIFSLVKYFSISPITDLSHHSLTSFVLKGSPSDLNRDSLQLTALPISTRWDNDLKEVLQDAFSHKDVSSELDNVFSSYDSDIDSIVEKFTGVVMRVTDPIIPKIKRKKKKTNIIQKQKWFTKDCHCLKKEIRNLGKLLSNQPNNSFLRQSFFAKKKDYKRLIKKVKRQFHSKILDNIKNMSDKNPKEFWNLVNSIRSNQSASKSLNDVPPSEWFNYFRDLNKVNFVSEDSSSEALVVKDFHLWAVSSNKILDEPISVEELLNLSKNLKSKKASAGDSVTNEIIKISLSSLAPYYVKLFNTILSKGVFPLSWSEGVIVPLHKSGPKSDPGNYRGICISSCLGKFFTLILNSRLNHFLEANNIMNKYQIGFRHGFRTSDHLLVLKTLIDYYKSCRKPLFACFVDFRKAYDSVWREGLFFKLIENGCSRKFINILISMYSSVKTAVKLEDGITPFFQSYTGVKQGCNLSPSLFNIFINDIPSLFSDICDPVKLGDSKLNCLLYADDLVLFSESETGLQNGLNSLEAYCNKWKLNVNLKKTKILVFCFPAQKRLFLNSHWFFGKQRLERVEEYTYLGLIFHFNGNFKLAIKSLYNKALRSYHGFMNSISNVENVPIKVLLKLFSSLVVPILLYGCEVWGVYLFNKISSLENFKQKLFSSISVIERLHLKFLKRILGVHNKTTNIAVYGELGRVPLIVQVSTLVAKYWLRINNPIFNSTLVGEAARICIQSNNQGVIFTNHLLYICELKSLNDLSIPLEDLNTCGKYIKSKLVNYFSLYWTDHLKKGSDNGKLRFFYKVKKNFSFENYLDKIVNIKYRQAVTKLRVSAHRLPVESGRYLNIDYGDRTCSLCDSTDVGDEYHYFLNCNHDKFENLRKLFFDNLSTICPHLCNFKNDDLFQYLLLMHDESTTNLCAKYCYDFLSLYNDLC